MLMILILFSNIKAKLKLKSIHFGQDKTKSILFGTKHKLRNAKTLNIVYNGIGTKQHAKVKHLGCILHESLSGESMALNVIDKINSHLKFLHRQNRFLTPPLTSPSNLICDDPQGSILDPLLFLLHINDLPLPVFSDSLLYSDDTCIVFQHKSEIESEKQLIRDFSSLCGWFVDNKLRIHFGQDKAKSILFDTKHKLQSAKLLNIVDNGIKIKQYAKVK